VKPRLLTALLVLGSGITGYGCGRSPAAFPSKPKGEWVLSWSDEFNGPTGSSPDTTKWVVEAGGSGWGNRELQYYTPRRENVQLENGNLAIDALQEEFTGADGVKRGYTSGRLKTQGLFSQKYGRFEARIQVPYGQGVWPAFWLLGDDFSTAGWPGCGEIDIMENVGSERSTVHGTLHGPVFFSGGALTSSYTLRQGRFSDGFHVFAAEWEPQVIRFYADEVLYATRTPADLPKGGRWVFDHPFFVIVDLAVGGDFPGNPDKSTVFPQRMLVDYVRVYSRE
jgi:beta-glucanase (GH16 family)